MREESMKDLANVMSYNSQKPADEKAIVPRDRPPKLVCPQPLVLIGIQEDTPVTWSPNGANLAFVSGSKSIYIATGFDQSQFRIANVLVGHKDKVSALAFHPTKPLLASCGAEGIFIWDLTKLVTVKKILSDVDEDAHEGGVEHIIWAFGGNMLMSASKDTNIKIFDVSDDYKCLETITGHKAPVLFLAINEVKYQLASAGRDSLIKIWDVSTLKKEDLEKRKDDGSLKVNQIHNLEGHRGDVITLTWSSDGITLYSGARDNLIKIWDMVSGQEMRSIAGHHGDIQKIVALNKEKLLCSASTDGTVRVWQTVPHTRPILQNEDASTISLDSILSDQKPLALVGGVPAGDKQVSSSAVHDEDCVNMDINPCFPLMATSSGYNCVRIWNIANLLQLQMLHEFSGHKGSCTGAVLVHDDTTVYSCSEDYFLNCYNIATLRRHNHWNCGGSLFSIAISYDCSLVFVGGTNYQIKGFLIDQKNPQRSREVLQLEGHCGRVECLATHPRDRLLLISGGHDFNILSWVLPDNLDPSKPIVIHSNDQIEAHQGHVTSLAFNEQGDAFATASTDHSLAVWSYSRKGSIKQLWTTRYAHSSVVSGVTFGRGPSSNLLFSCSWDCDIKVWNAKQPGKMGAPLATLSRHNARLTSLSVSPNGRYLVSGCASGRIMLWETSNDFPCVCVYTAEHEGAINTIHGGSNTIISGSETGMLQVWPLPDVELYKGYFLPYEKASVALDLKDGGAEPEEVVEMTLHQ